MSSGFVSAGTNEEPKEHDDEWHKAQQELEEERRQKAEQKTQDGGKSLYDVLQQNKMAKQEAFEEKTRLKNQFRALDEDEVEFLDSLLESTRTQEASIKKETAEQLEVFHRQREQAEKALVEGTSEKPSAEEENWTIPARKRRREKNKNLLLPGKKRKSSAAESSGDSLPQTEQKPNSGPKPIGNNVAPGSNPVEISQKPVDANKPSEEAARKHASDKATFEEKPAPKPAPKPATVSLGLAGYSSDSE